MIAKYAKLVSQRLRGRGHALTLAGAKPHASYPQQGMRIAVDIDSTLHHYWDVLAEVARRRFGVELPYDEQRTWGITTLAPADLRAAVAETHEEAQVLAGRPYPGAVEALRDWHAAGHYIHVTSHRVPALPRGHRAMARSDPPALRRPAL